MPETTLVPGWNFRLIYHLESLGSIVGVLILCLIGLKEDLSWMAWVVAGVVLIVLSAIRWPYGALIVLVGASTMSRFVVELFGWNARPEHFAIGIVSFAFCIWLLKSNLKPRLENLDYWILAYVVASYISSLFGSSSPHDTLRWALLSNLAIVPYFIVRFFVRDIDMLRKAFRILLAVGVAESCYGIMCYLLHYTLETTTGMEIGQYMGVAAPYGSLYEANVFGAYTGCTAILALAMYLAGERRLGYLICFFLASLAAVLSFSRAALIALVVAAAWVYWQGRRARREHRRWTLTPIVAIVVVLLIAVPAVGSVVQERFHDLLNQGFTEQTTISRLVEAQEALQEFSEHRLIGTGTASFQLSFDWGKYLPEMQGKRTWVGNVTVRILHDTGLLGLGIILGFLICLGWKIWLLLRARTAQAPMLIALAGGALLYAISMQATDATLEAFPWIHLGLLTSGAILAEQSGENTNRMGSTVQKSV